MNIKFKYIYSILLVLIIFISVFRLIYINVICVEFNGTIYKRDIKSITLFSVVDDDDIRNVNKCNKLEHLSMFRVNENQVARIKKSNIIKELFIYYSTLHKEDIKNINNFNNLQTLFITGSNVDFMDFINNTVSTVNLSGCEIKNLESLAKCKSLNNVRMMTPIIVDSYIVMENGKYILKDSSIFTSWDTVQMLGLDLDKIKDISGILEMKSLKEIKVNKDSISEEEVKLLEDKGISIIYLQ